MKKLITLFFMLSILCFGIESESIKSIKSNDTKQEVEMLKNQVIELSSQIMKSNNKIDELNKELKGVKTQNGENLGLTYNIDQIYGNSVKFYDKTIEDTKEIYNKNIEDIDRSIGRAQWVLGILFSVIIALGGFLQFRNDKLLKSEKDEIKNDNEKLRTEVRNDNKELKDKIESETKKLAENFNKKILEYEEKMKNQITNLEKEIKEINQKHSEEINKIKDEIKKDREEVEFRTRLMRAMNKKTSEEKINELEKMLESKEIYTDIENSEIYFQLGYELSMIDRNEEAINNYEEVIKLNPKNFVVYNNRAESRIFINEYSLALEDLEKGLKIDENYKLGIDITKENYDEFKSYLEKIEKKTEIQEEIYRRVKEKEGFTFVEPKENKE